MRFSMRKTSYRCSGFTLVELLVVIAIIAILVALVAPPLHTAREGAKTAGCLSNLKQLGVAIRMYATDEGGKLPPLWVKTSSGGVNEGWPTILQSKGYIPAAPNTITRNPPFFTKSPLYCPSGLTDRLAGPVDLDDVRDINLGRPQFWGSPVLGSPAHVWYGVNGRTWDPTHRFPLQAIPDDSDPTDVWPNTLLSITTPSKLVFAFDGVAFNISSHPERIHARHNRKTTTNIAFFDGHVSSFLREKLPMPGDPNFLYDFDLFAKRYPDIFYRIDQ